MAGRIIFGTKLAFASETPRNLDLEDRVIMHRLALDLIINSLE